MRYIWLWCSHFEHAFLEDLRNLGSFLQEALPLLSTTEDCAGVEMLDNIGEKIVLAFYSPPESTVELLKSRGARTSDA
jgi:hypothetical protein